MLLQRLMPPQTTKISQIKLVTQFRLLFFVINIDVVFLFFLNFWIRYHEYFFWANKKYVIEISSIILLLNKTLINRRYIDEIYSRRVHQNLTIIFYSSLVGTKLLWRWAMKFWKKSLTRKSAITRTFPATMKLKTIRKMPPIKRRRRRSAIKVIKIDIYFSAENFCAHCVNWSSEWC